MALWWGGGVQLHLQEKANLEKMIKRKKRFNKIKKIDHNPFHKWAKTDEFLGGTSSLISIFLKAPPTISGNASVSLTGTDTR